MKRLIYSVWWLCWLSASGCGTTASEDGCVTGRSAACACKDGRTGAQYCRSDRTYDACVCTGSPALGCVPGQSAACACTDGRTGAQLCRNDRTYAACMCTGEPGVDIASPEPFDLGFDIGPAVIDLRFP